MALLHIELHPQPFIYFYFLVPRIELASLCLRGRTTELKPQPQPFIFLF